MTPRPRYAILLACLLLAGGGAQARAAHKGAKVPTWPQAVSDVPADPKVRFGVLPNGLRYAILKNATPTGQASLRMCYDAGSLMETDAQQGVAHFLEHMNFNGSRHVAEDEMVKILERHGLAFGADTNAQTSWTETVYQLDLPRADDDTIDTALMLLREGASELLIDNGAVGRERGVVLSEERARDTPGLRVFKQSQDFFLRGQLAARRLPIGKVEVIKAADHDLIAGFYDRYYRPQRAVLVAVGDFDVDAMLAKIKARFGDWKGRGPSGTEPDLGTVARRGAETRLVVEPGSSLQIQLEWLKPADRSPDTRAYRQRRLIEQLALAVLNRRLERLARTSAPPFIAAQASKDDVFHSAEVTTLSVAAQPDQWRTALVAADHEQRRLAQFGVRQDEIDREIMESRVQLQSAVAGAATRRTPRLADSIVDTLDDKEVFTTPATDLALFEAEVKSLTAKQVSIAAREVFSGQGPLLFMATPQPIDGGEPALAKVYADARAEALQPAVADKLKTWPYADFGPPGKIAERQEVADLGVTQVRFENGVRLNVKPTKFRDNQVLVRVRLGHGQLDLPRDRVSPMWAARGAFVEGGLKALSTEEMEKVLASNIVGADISAGEDSFNLQGTTRPEDLAIQMQMLTAYASQPGFRPDPFLRMKTYIATLYDQLAATPSGVMSRDLGKLMHGGDPRFAFPSPADVSASTPEDFKALLGPRLASGPVEVTIVGDTTVDKAVALTAATFGALPARTDQPAPPEASAVTLPTPAPKPVTLTHKGRADQAIAYAEWPTDGFFADVQGARTLRVLAQVIELRLLQDLREAAGDTYSPQAGATSSLTFPHFGYVSAVVEIPPAKLDDFYRDLAKISADLRANDVSADELQRAKKPIVESLQKSRQTNEYWLEQLSGAQAEPRRLDAIRGVIASLDRIGPVELKAAAQRYLLDDKVWKLQIVPAAPAP